MAPPHDLPDPHWATSAIASIQLTNTVEGNWNEPRGDSPGDDAATDSTQVHSKSDRVVPRARCRECTDRPGVRGLCIACFLE